MNVWRSSMRCEVLEGSLANSFLDTMAECDEQEYVYFERYCIGMMRKVYREWLQKEKVIF